MLLKFDPPPPSAFVQEVEDGALFSDTSTPPSCHFPSASPGGWVMSAPPSVLGAYERTAALVSEGQLPAWNRHLDGR